MAERERILPSRSLQDNIQNGNDEWTENNVNGLKSSRCCCLVAESYLSRFQPHGLTATRQAPLSMGFSRQEYWRGLPFPSPRDLPDPGIEPEPPALAGGFFTTEPPGKPIPKTTELYP